MTHPDRCTKNCGKFGTSPLKNGEILVKAGPLYQEISKTWHIASKLQEIR